MSEETIIFSVTERISLANQFRILESVDTKQAAEHARKAQILEGGFEDQYASIYGRFNENRLAKENCRLVEKTLLLHSWLMDWKGKSNIDVSEFQQLEFDANEEWHLLSYANFLYDQNPQGYPGVTSVVDAHRPTVGRWKKMVKAWEDKEHSTGSEADVSRIIASGLSYTE